MGIKVGNRSRKGENRTKKYGGLLKSRARMRLKGTVHFDTRRTAGRRLRFNDELARKIVLYALSVAAKKYKIDVHIFVLMGNHYHILVSAHFRNYPLFEAFLNSRIALCMNQLHDLDGQFWETIYSNNTDQTVLSAARSVTKAKYICANPIRAGLESDLHEWSQKMVLISPLDWNKRIVCERPSVYWSENMPSSVSLKPKPLPKLRDFDAVEFMIEVSKTPPNATFAGVDALLKTSPFEVPVEEKLRFVSSPDGLLTRLEILANRKPLRRFAGTDEEEESAQTSQSIFAFKHGVRRRELIEGDRDSPFPSGTLLFRTLGFETEPDPPIHLFTRLIRGP